MKRRISFAIAGVVALSVIAVRLSVTRLNGEAGSRLQSKLRIIEQKTGIKTRGDGFSVGFGSLRINSLRIILPKRAIERGGPRVAGGQQFPRESASANGDIVEIFRQIEPSLRSLVRELRQAERHDKRTFLPSIMSWILPRRIVLDIGHIEILAASETASDWLVHADDFHVRIDRRSPRLNFHAREFQVTGFPAESNVSGHLRLWPRTGDIELAASQAPDADYNGWGWRVRTGTDARKVHMEFTGAHMPPSIAGISSRLINTRIMPSRDTSFDASLDITRLGDEMLEFEASLDFRDLYVGDTRIATNEIGPLHLDASASGKFDPGSSELIVDYARIEFPAPIEFEPAQRNMAQRSNYDFEVSGSVEPAVIVNFRANGPLELAPALRRLMLAHFPPKSRRTAPGSWNVRAFIARTPCQGLLDIVPAKIAPVIHQYELAGDFMGIATLTWPKDRPGDFEFKVTHDEFSCQVAKEPAGYAAENFNGPLKARLGSRKMRKRDVELSPANENFTPFRGISRNFVTTVIAAEDTGFWHHKGVAAHSFFDALRDNINEGRMARGGSTITMQMVKNLMLSPERTIGRKAQEYFLAWHLGHSLTHERILELYANMIELGPDVFGVGEAADIYFGKKPSELSLKESVFLVTLLPGPVSRIEAFCRKHEPTPNFTRLMNDLIERMDHLGVITSTQAEEARHAKLTFRHDDAANTRICHPATEST
jgi:hypothetical protein